MSPISNRKNTSKEKVPRVHRSEDANASNAKFQRRVLSQLSRIMKILKMVVGTGVPPTPPRRRPQPAPYPELNMTIDLDKTVDIPEQRITLDQENANFVAPLPRSITPPLLSLASPVRINVGAESDDVSRKSSRLRGRANRSQSSYREESPSLSPIPAPRKRSRISQRWSEIDIELIEVEDSDPGPPAETTSAKDKNFKCPQCPKSYQSARSLKDHAYFHKGETECTFCSLVYMNLRGFRKHQEICSKKRQKLLDSLLSVS